MNATRRKYLSAVGTANAVMTNTRSITVSETVQTAISHIRDRNDSNQSATPVIRPDGGCQIGPPKDEKSDEVSKLNLVTQVTRANLIQNILGHACMMPSLKELDHYNPSKSAGTLSGHLDKLIDAGIVRRMTLPQGRRQRNLPSTFYTLSDEGYELLERHSLFLPNLDEIRADHAHVEKSETVKRYEQAPRPTADVGYDHPLKGDGMTIVVPQGPEDEDGCKNWENVDEANPEEIAPGL